MIRILLAAGMLLSAAWLSAPSDAQAQSYPSKTVRLVLPSGPGGPTDLVARLLAEGLKTLWGVPVLVENRPGAGGNIGAEFAARAEPDGYTLLFSNVGTMVANQAIYSNISFNSLTDFAPISLLVESPTFIYVRSDLPINSLDELIAFAKKEPGKLNYADAGLGTLPGLGAELMKHLTKTDMTRISYRDGSQVTAALETKQFDVYFTGIEASQYVKSGKMKLLAICAPSRHPMAPDIKTTTELGVPGLQISGWYGLLAPVKTSPAIVQKLHADSVKALQLPEIKGRLEQMGLILVLTTPDQFGQRIKTERAQWDDVIKAAGIKAN